MSELPRTVDQKLSDLAEKLDDHERRKPQPVERPRSTQKPPAAVGPKTRLTLRIMAVGFSVFWVLWLVLAWFAAQPHTISDLFVIPFSGAIVWACYQFHKMILISSVQKGSALLSQSRDDR
jgi:hypothetical protein